MFVKKITIIKRRDKHKQAEASLRESEEKLRLVFESVKEGIVVSGLDGKILDVNKGVLQMHDYDKKEELIGLNVSMLIAKRDFSRAKKGIQNISESGIIIECNFVKKDGSEFPAMVSTTVIRDSTGRPSGAVSIITDITDQRKIQQQLMLADRLASVGQLAAGIAHEINNPLTSVIGFSELLLERDIPADVREDLEIIDKEAKRAATVIWGLLTFVRSKGTEKTIVDVNAVIQEILRLRSYEQKVNNIILDIRLYPELPPVRGNAAQLQQVFMNLVINAEQAMHEANGRGKLEIMTDKSGDTVRILVNDDGPGISPTDINKLFTPFFTTKEVGNGTGLGLSICHGIITEHGGKIYTRSQPGKGSSFVVELPIFENGGEPNE